MTNAAGLDANAYLSLTRRSEGPLYEVKRPGFRYFDRPIRLSHLRLLVNRCRPCSRAKLTGYLSYTVWSSAIAEQNLMSGLQCSFCNRPCDVSSANKTEFRILSSASILHEVIGARLRCPLWKL